MTPQAPPRSPEHQIRKVESLSFHWKKKINVVAFLERFLHAFEVSTFSALHWESKNQVKSYEFYHRIL